MCCAKISNPRTLLIILCSMFLRHALYPFRIMAIITTLAAVNPLGGLTKLVLLPHTP